MSQYPADEETVLVLLERVNEAQRIAQRELKEILAQDPRSKKRRRDADDADGDDGDIAESFASSKKKQFKAGNRSNFKKGKAGSGRGIGRR